MSSGDGGRGALDNRRTGLESDQTARAGHPCYPSAPGSPPKPLMIAKSVQNAFHPVVSARVPGRDRGTAAPREG